MEADARARRWTLVAVCTTTFMLLLDITIVNVALPSIQRHLDAGLTGLQWVVDAYALTLAALILTAGARPGPPGRCPCRPLRPAGSVHRRPAGLHRSILRLRHRLERRRARRRTRGSGRR